MRCLLLPASLLLLAACAGPAYTGLHGQTSLTITQSSAGGEGVPLAGPGNAKVCRWTGRDLGTHLTLRLGPSCVLDSDWNARTLHGGRFAAAAGGAGAVAPGQPCVVTLGETKTALVVQSGAITQAAEGGPIDATIGGITPGDAPRYVTFRFVGSPYERGSDAWCEHVAREELEASASRP